MKPYSTIKCVFEADDSGRKFRVYKGRMVNHLHAALIVVTALDKKVVRDYMTKIGALRI